MEQQQHTQERLITSIARGMLLLLGIHGLLAFLIHLSLDLDSGGILAFLAILVVHHGLVAVMLFNMLHFFINSKTGEALSKLNFPLLLTLARITSLPTLLYLIILADSQEVYPFLIGYMSFAFVSDFLDGNISRRMKQTTVVGAYLDSMSDYAVLIGISIAYIVYQLLPLWFFVLVLTRLFFQWAAAALLILVRKEFGPHRTSLLAKLSIFLIMFCYAGALLQFLPWAEAAYPLIRNILLAVTAPVLIASLVEKAVICCREMMEQKSR